MGILRVEPVAPVAPEEQYDEFNKVKALIKLFLAMLFQTLFANNIFENYQLCKICFERICADIIDAENIEKINYFMQLIKLTVNAKKQFNIFVVDPDHLYIDIDENGMPLEPQDEIDDDLLHVLRCKQEYANVSKKIGRWIKQACHNADVDPVVQYNREIANPNHNDEQELNIIRQKYYNPIFDVVNEFFKNM